MKTEYFFATPIYHAQIDNELIHSQIDYLLDNLSDQDLNSPWFDNIKTTFKYKGLNNTSAKIPLLELEIKKHSNSYLNEVLKTEQHDFDVQIIESWLNVSHTHHFQHYHSHFGGELSAVFYHKSNECDGDIIFANPSLASRMNRLTMKNDTIRYKPKKGKILIFPSFLEHAVNINQTNNTRVSIAFNLSINNIES